MQCFESPIAVKAVCHDSEAKFDFVNVTKLFQNLLACKSGSILLYTDDIGSSFLSCAGLMCNLSLEIAAWLLIKLRLLYTTL